jgi:predicted DNA-binding transcriptional regulator AlpA
MQNIINPSAPAHVQQLRTALIRRKQVEAITGLSRPVIYAKLDENSPQYDPTFPKQVTLGPMSVAWIENEVYDWINSVIAKSRAATKTTGKEAFTRKEKIAAKRAQRKDLAVTKKTKATQNVEGA